MKRILTVTLAVTILLVSSCARQTEPNPPEPAPLSVAEVVSKVNPSVVQIVTADGTGSGIILDTDGHVLTNNHVIEKAASASVVVSDGQTLSARILNRDWSIDLAVLKVTASGLQPATLGSSSEVQLGEDVITLGYPLDLGSSVTVTKGIVSAFRGPYVQTDAPVNLGNSGGPLVNMWGEVIGLVTAKPVTQDQEPAEGIGFAIAIDRIKDKLTSLLSPQKSPSLTAYTTTTDALGTQPGLLTSDAFDNMHYVWGEHLPWGRAADEKPKLLYYVKPKGGGWSSPEIVTKGCPDYDPPYQYDLFVEPEAITADIEGKVHLVWIQDDYWPIPLSGGFTDGHSVSLYYASKAIGQAWSTPTCLSKDRQFGASSLVADPAGALHLVCAERADLSNREPGIWYLYKPKQAAWSQPELIQGSRLSETAWTEDPTLSCDSQGNLCLAYCLESASSATTWTGPIYAARKVAGAPWSLPAQTVDGVGPLQSLVNSDGESVIAFTDVAFQEYRGRIALSSLSPDQSWSAIQYLSGADHLCRLPCLTRDVHGTIYAIWVRTQNPEDTGTFSLVLRWKTPSNAWSGEFVVHESVDDYVFAPSFVVDSAGNGVLLMREYSMSDPTPICRFLTLALGQTVN